MRPSRKTESGWVLMEALVAMVVLSVAIVALNRAFAEAVYTRAIARDYTQARFLLEQVTGELEIKPMHEDGASGSGDFGEDYPRFSYSWTVSKQDVPPPQLPAIIPVELQAAAANFQPPIEYLGKIAVQVHWTRSGQNYSAELETAIPPGGIRIQEEADNAAPL